MADGWIEDALFTDEANHEVFDPHAHHPTGFVPAGILDQDRFWVDQAGQMHELASMSTAYRENVLVALHGYATVLWAHAAAGELLNNSLGTLMAMAACGVPFVCELEPGDWLVSTPLMKALHAGSPHPA